MDGSLRAATWVGSDGRKGELRLDAIMSQKLNARQSTVYATLGKHEGLTVAELTNFTGMSQTTVRKALREMQDMQLALVDDSERPYVWFQSEPALVAAAGPEPEHKSEVEVLREKLAEARGVIEHLVVQNLRLVWSTEDIKR